MSETRNDFRVRLGRIRNTRTGKSKSFVNQVLRAAKKAGHQAAETGAGTCARKGLPSSPRRLTRRPRSLMQACPDA